MCIRDSLSAPRLGVEDFESQTGGDLRVHQGVGEICLGHGLVTRQLLPFDRIPKGELRGDSAEYLGGGTKGRRHIDIEGRRRKDRSVRVGAVLSQIVGADEPSEGMSVEHPGKVGADETRLDDALDIVEVVAERADVGAGSLRLSVAPQIECRNGIPFVREEAGNVIPAPEVLTESVDDEET